MPERPPASAPPRVAWLTTPQAWERGWRELRPRFEAAGLEVEVLCLGGAGIDGLAHLGSLALPVRPFTFARLVARLTDGDFALLHLLDDGVRSIGLPAARLAGQRVVMASVGAAPWPTVSERATGRIAGARALFEAKPDDATLLIAMGQEAAAAHNDARRLDPLRWVTLEEGLGLPTLLPAPAARRRGDGPLRVMVDGAEGSVVLPALPGVEVEFLGSLPPELALRKARHADLWVCIDAAGRHRALTAAQGGAALLVPALPEWDWVARCRGGAACATGAFAEQVTALCADRDGLRSSGERAAVYAARHLEPSAVTGRLLAWYDDLLALNAGTSGPATLDLSALGAGVGATEGRARRDLLTGLREG